MCRNAHERKMLLKLLGYWIIGVHFKIAHRFLQNLAYHNSYRKSIHKKQQNFLKKSIRSTAVSALVVIVFYINHINSLYLYGPGAFRLENDESRLIIGAMIILVIQFSTDIPLVFSKFCRASTSSDIDSRAPGMISFWVETLFLISSRPAHPVLPQLPQEPRTNTDRHEQGKNKFEIRKPTEHTENTEKKGLREGVT